MADARHNVPASLLDYGKPFDEKRIHEALVHDSDLAREREWKLLGMNFSKPPPTPPSSRMHLVGK